MTKQEIQAEIERLKQKLEECDSDNAVKIPETLAWDYLEKYYYTTGFSEKAIDYDFYNGDRNDDRNGAKNHMIFKTEEYAKMFLRRIRFIADLLHFKWLYDRDYKPDWNNDSRKHCVCFSRFKKSFIVSYVYETDYKETVYFSSADIAQKCADWLNNRNYEQYRGK